MKFRKPLWLIAATTLAAVLLSSCNLGGATPAPTVDVGAIQTEAFSVVLTQAAINQAQTAMAAPPVVVPTDTPFPTPTMEQFLPLPGFATPSASVVNTPFSGFTPLATVVSPTAALATVTTKNGCNDGTYISEAGFKDGATLKGGEAYEKSWSILNTGTCPWDEGYAFVLVVQYSSPEIVWEHTSIVIKGPTETTKPQGSQNFVIKFTAPKKAGAYEAYWKLRDDGNNYFGPMVWLKFVVVKP